MVADKVLWQPECVQPPPSLRKNSPLAAQLKIAFRRFLLYLDHEQLSFFCPTYPSLSPFKSPSHAVTKARLTKTKMAAERRSAMSAETPAETAQSPTFMKNISSRPDSISPSVTPFSGALMELDEYRQKPLFFLPFSLCSGAT